MTWHVDKPEMNTLLKAVTTLTPSSLKQKQNMPWTPTFITVVLNKLDLANHLCSVVESCILMVSFTTAHLGELTVLTLKAFDTSHHVKPSNIFTDTDQHGLVSTIFHLPQTKMGGPKDVPYSAQTGRIDPEAALQRHLTLNKPPAKGPLFT